MEKIRLEELVHEEQLKLIKEKVLAESNFFVYKLIKEFGVYPLRLIGRWLEVENNSYRHTRYYHTIKPVSEKTFQETNQEYLLASSIRLVDLSSSSRPRYDVYAGIYYIMGDITFTCHVVKFTFTSLNAAVNKVEEIAEIIDNLEFLDIDIFMNTFLSQGGVDDSY